MRSIGQEDHLIIAFIDARVEATRLSVLLWSFTWLYDVVDQTNVRRRATSCSQSSHHLHHTATSSSSSSSSSIIIIITNEQITN